MDVNKKTTARARCKKGLNTFFVEKHMNKLPMWKITIPGQIPSWKEIPTIKLKSF